MRRALALPLAALLVGCPGKKNPFDDDDDDTDAVSGTPSPSPSASPEPDDVRVSFTALDFTHTFNVSPCPQTIGAVTITNPTDDAASLDLAASGPYLWFDDDPSTSVTRTVPAGGSITVEVKFNCDACVSAGFTSTVTVDVTAGAAQQTFTEGVTATFVDCP